MMLVEEASSVSSTPPCARVGCLRRIDRKFLRSPSSQIDEELLFHITTARLRAGPGVGLQVQDRQQAQPDGSVSDVHQLDLPAPPIGTFPTVPKLRIRNAVARGVRILHILQFAPGRNPAGYDLSGLADTHSLNPRLIVGTVRLAACSPRWACATRITRRFTAPATPSSTVPDVVSISPVRSGPRDPEQDPTHPTITDLT